MKTWRHRLYLVAGVALVICSHYVPILAPMLGPLAVKVLAGAGIVSLAAADVRAALAPPAPAAKQ